MKWQQYTSASMPYGGKSSGYISMPIFMPFLPSTLSANAKKHKNVVNKWTDGQKIIPISINKLRLSRLDTSACQNDDVFVQEICPQYQNPSPRTVERKDERIKSKQYPSALMLPRLRYLNTSACQIVCHFLQVICQQMCRNLKKVVNERADEGISMPSTLNLEQEKMWSEEKI